MEKYKKYFKKYKKHVIDEDWTTAHECQDKIYKKLVLDIVNNKLTFDEINCKSN
jgi:hypothetical protein